MDGEADGRWNFRKNGPLLSNKAQADTRLLPDLAAELAAAVAHGRPDHARAEDPRPPRGGRPDRARPLLGRRPEPPAGPRRPGHDRGREPAPPRRDQEGERAAAGVRPPEERVRRHRGPRLPPAADGDPGLRRARARGAGPAARDAPGVHAHGDQRDRPPGPPRERHAPDHADRDRPAQLQLPRGGRGAVPARGGAPRPLRPLGAPGRAARGSRGSGRTPIACARP